jgi:copper resistance protein B
MKRLELSLLAAVAGMVLAGPASAQMNMNMPGMSMPGMKMPAAKSAPGKKQPAKKLVAKGASAKTTKTGAKASPLHTKSVAKTRSSTAGHDMSAMPGMAPTPGHDMTSMPGMAMPADQDMKDMPGMAMPAASGTEASGTDLPAGNAPPPAVPTDHAADQAYGAAAMAMGRHHLGEFHGGQKMGQLLVNIAEYHFNRGRDGYQWVGQGWYGGDINRLWVKSQGDGEIRRGVERAEVQGLFSHAIGPYFNLQGGVRHDFRPTPSRTYATVGIEGLAPSFFDLEAALFLSNKGELMGRIEGSYDQRITQRLILQPRVEINAAAQDSRSIGVGSGLSDVEAGVRLRYDIRREFAPYVGVQYKRAFGTTGRYLTDVGERRGGWSVLTGIRTWF